MLKLNTNSQNNVDFVNEIINILRDNDTKLIHHCWYSRGRQCGCPVVTYVLKRDADFIERAWAQTTFTSQHLFNFFMDAGVDHNVWSHVTKIVDDCATYHSDLLGIVARAEIIAKLEEYRDNVLSITEVTE